MFVLGINTATAVTAVALLEIAGKNCKTLYANSWISNRDEAEKLLPEIKKVLRKKKIDAIFVVGGPGAFTSLRVGVTVANVLAYALSMPVYSVSTFDYLKASVADSCKKNTLVIMRAGGEYVAVLAPNQKKEKRILKTDLPAYLKKNKNLKFAVTDSPDAGKWLPKARMIAPEKVMGVLMSKKTRAKKQVVPRYLLPPKITVSKKEVFV